MRAFLGQVKQKLTTYAFRHGTRLVDLEWYRSKTPIHGFLRRFPLLHYYLFGSRSTAQCYPLFDIEYFATQCKQANLPIPQKVLKTYLKNKNYWRINPHPLFDADFYIGQMREAINQSPLMHYINGGHLHHDPHPLFQHTWYFISFPGLKKLTQHCPLLHYIKIGFRNNPSTHPLFHADFYAKNTGIPLADQKTTVNALMNFVTSTNPSLSCHPLFDLNFYHEQKDHHQQHVQPAYLTIKQYLLQPDCWAYSTHLLFDATFYSSQPSGKKTEKSPLEEYISHNFHIRNPHPLFNTRWYQGRKKNILQFTGQGRVPLVHFVLNGYRMGESPSPLFALQWYRNTYMQGRVDDTNPLIEFITQGEAVGNRPNPLYPTNWQEWLLKKYNSTTLAEYAQKNPIRAQNFHNRISDAFSTPYINNNNNEAKSYLILFTPRSGSSWLTDIITQQKILGRPTEWFNPDLIQSAMNGLSRKTYNIHEYCQELQNTHKSPEGYFGAELTASHLSLLTDLVDIQSTFNNPAYILLLRKNIIAQGISLHLATTTGYFHATNTINQDNLAEYSEVKIKKWVNEIIKDEKYFHQFIKRKEIDFLMLWHEDIKANTQNTISAVSNHITNGLLSTTYEPESAHAKIGSSINKQFEERFRDENKAFIDNIDKQRANLFGTETSLNTQTHQIS